MYVSASSCFYFLLTSPGDEVPDGGNFYEGKGEKADDSCIERSAVAYRVYFV